MKDMILTEEMQKVMTIVTESNDNVFVTGKAGSGKTTFLKHLIKNNKKNCIVAAPTGVAAINAGGVTLHSLFGIPFGPITPYDRLDCKFSTYKHEMLLRLDTLIIDEISMVRPDIIDTIDRKLRWVCESDEPFGGKQVIMFGDLFQLPPVVKEEERKILQEYYDDFYFFNARVWKRVGFHVVELTKIFRQSDEAFINLLNNIRNYNVTSNELDILSELKNNGACQRYDNGNIHICTHRKTVDEINMSMLGTSGIQEYSVMVKDKFPESSMPCDSVLKLRKGARVMALINDATKGYYNGMLGTVVDLDFSTVTVRMDNGNCIKFERHTWSNEQYVLEGDEIKKTEIGSCTQFPLTLAWAITIHKSQGLTFDHIALHVTRAFCPGQIYVALSRCRTLDGIVLNGNITRKMVIPDYALTDFERAYKQSDNWFGKKEQDEDYQY